MLIKGGLDILIIGLHAFQYFQTIHFPPDFGTI